MTIAKLHEDEMTSDEIGEAIDRAIFTLQEQRPKKSFILVSPSRYQKLLDVVEAAQRAIELCKFRTEDQEPPFRGLLPEMIANKVQHLLEDVLAALEADDDK